jgi:hypothetical protein
MLLFSPLQQPGQCCNDVNDILPRIGDRCLNNWTRIATPAVNAAPSYTPDLAWCPDFAKLAQYGDGHMKKDMTGKKPIDFSSLFFPPAIYTHVAEQTNVYAL